MTKCAKRMLHETNNMFRLRDFNLHQLSLAMSAIVMLIGSMFAEWLLVPLMLILQGGAVEALRFRRTGNRFMTRRSIWIGATPVDTAARPLLKGWHP